MSQQDPHPMNFRGPRNLRVDELLKIYDEVLPDVEQVLRTARITTTLPVPEVPAGIQPILRWVDNDPIPPDDLTGVTLDQIGQMLSFFTSWTNYVQAEATKAGVFREVQDQHLVIIKSAISIHYRQSGRNESEAKDYVYTDERYVEQHSIYLKLVATCRHMEARYEELKRVLNNLSREQTRRADLDPVTGKVRPSRWRGGGRPPRDF